MYDLRTSYMREDLGNVLEVLYLYLNTYLCRVYRCEFEYIYLSVYL